MFGLSGYVLIGAGVAIALAAGVAVVQTKRLENAKANLAIEESAKLAWKDAAEVRDQQMKEQQAQHQRDLAALAAKAKADASRRADFAKIEKEVANAPSAQCDVGPGVRAALDGLRQRQGVAAGEDGVPAAGAPGGAAVVPGRAPGAGG